MDTKLTGDRFQDESLLKVIAPYVIGFVLFAMLITALFDRYIAQIYSAEITVLVCAGAVIIPLILMIAVILFAPTSSRKEKE